MSNTYQASERDALISEYDDIYLVDGRRTPFADYCGVMREVSPIDLGIYAARATFEHSGIPASDVDAVIAGSVAQASFDAFMLPRHIGLYSGVKQTAPSLLVHRLCATGFEAILTAADQIKLGKAKLVLCAGAESMSRNPVASYTQRAGFKLGQVEFGDFLWEAMIDTAPDMAMGHTAEELAKRYNISRADVDDYAARSFATAIDAWDRGFYNDEVVSVSSTEFPLEGYKPAVSNSPTGLPVSTATAMFAPARWKFSASCAQPLAVCKPAVIPRPLSTVQPLFWSPLVIMFGRMA